MKKYLVLYRSHLSAGEQMSAGTPEQMKASMDAWMAWAQRAGAGLVDMGSPLGEMSHLGEHIHHPGHIGGYSVLAAESMDAAKKLLDGHPHLSMPGGASIELLEFLPIPGM